MESPFKAPASVPETFDTFWHFEGIEASPPEGSIGFVYIITNTLTGKQYIGKKGSRTKKTRQKTVTLKNGTKKKKKIVEYIDSDWRAYYGSNDQLKKDVEEFGADKFFREVLVWTYTLGEASYIEGWYHFHFNVLLYPEQYYNRWIMLRVSDVHIKKLIESQKG